MNEKIKRYIESALDAAQEEMISALSDMSEDELDSVITSSDELPEDGMSNDFLDYDDTDGMSDDFSDFADDTGSDDEILSADDLMASLNDGDTDEDDSTKFEAVEDDGTDDITLADDEKEDEKPKVEAKKPKNKPFKIVPRV